MAGKGKPWPTCSFFIGENRSKWKNVKPEYILILQFKKKQHERGSKYWRPKKPGAAVKICYMLPLASIFLPVPQAKSLSSGIFSESLPKESYHHRRAVPYIPGIHAACCLPACLLFPRGRTASQHMASAKGHPGSRFHSANQEPQQKCFTLAPLLPRSMHPY